MRAAKRLAPPADLWDPDEPDAAGQGAPSGTQLRLDPAPPDPPDPEQQQAAMGYAEFAGSRSRRRGITNEMMAIYDDEMDRMRTAENWSAAWGDAGPGHLLALHLYLYQLVYQWPEVVARPHRIKVVGVIKTLCKACFDDNAQDMANYIRWMWQKEKRQEIHRRENGSQSTWKLTWNKLFTRAMVMEYRVERDRRAGVFSRDLSAG